MADNPLYNDPFDVEMLRASVVADIGVERLPITLTARKPRRTEFFRVHPDPAMVLDWFVVEREDDNEIYWVTPQFHAALINEIRSVRVFPCLNKHGTEFLWPARLPAADNRLGRRWHESALDIAERARKQWLRMFGNRDAGHYEAFVAKGDLGTPDWPDRSLREWLELAFTGDRVIDRLDHPILRELSGEI